MSWKILLTSERCRTEATLEVATGELHFSCVLTGIIEDSRAGR